MNLRHLILPVAILTVLAIGFADTFVTRTLYGAAAALA